MGLPGASSLAHGAVLDAYSRTVTAVADRLLPRLAR
jgi:hypothetical protein